MESLSFNDKRFQIAISYIGESLKEKDFVQNENYYTRNNITLIVNMITNDVVNGNIILTFSLINEVGQLLAFSNAVLKSESNMTTNFLNIDLTLKGIENSMILQSLISDEGTKSESGTFSKLEKYYIIQGSKRVPISSVTEELKRATKGINKITSRYEVVGGIRRKNQFIEDITILVEGNSNTAKELCEKYELTDKNENKYSKIISLENKIVTENYIVVNKKFFGNSLIRNTGSYVFVKAVEERAKSLGLELSKIKGENEQDVFNILRIPYISPECRECKYNIQLPISEILLNKVPELDINDKVITFKDFVINGKAYVNSIRKERLIGIKIECLSQYDSKQMDCFDFVVGGFYLNNQTSMRFAMCLNKINKPLIIDNFGTDLSIPLRIINSRVNWETEFKNMIKKNVIIYVNSKSNNLHPVLLNMYQKLGGKFIVENSETALNLSRKALLAKSNIIHNDFRFEKIGEI